MLQNLNLEERKKVPLGKPDATIKSAEKVWDQLFN